METKSPLPAEKKALAELHAVLSKSEKFVKAHAAEYLIWTGHKEAALRTFLAEEVLHGNEPKYRVVIWRVLVQAEDDITRKQMWLRKIYAAYTDLNGPDRTHATETLAKLKQPVGELFPEITSVTLQSEDRNLQTYALWASAFDSQGQMTKNRDRFLEMALSAEDLVIRRISAFVLRQSKGLTMAQWEKLEKFALAVPPREDTYLTFLATALVTAPTGVEQSRLDKIKDLMVKNIQTYGAGQQIELSLALAEKGEVKQLQLLTAILDNKYSAGRYNPSSEEGADLRAAAAYAILRIKNKQATGDSPKAVESDKNDKK